MSGFRKSNEFPQLSDGIRAIYSDSVNDYQDNWTLVWTPDSSRQTVEEIRYEGLVTEAEVIRRATFDLAHVRKRNALYTWTAPVEFILCRKGDLVGVQSPVISINVGVGRIQTITLNLAGTKITKIKLDETIPAFGSVGSSGGINVPSGQFGIAILRNDGETTTHAATLESDKRTLDIATPIDLDSDIAVGCVVSCGTLGQEYLRLIVKEIVPKDTTSAQIIAFDEAPDLTAAI